VLNVEVLNMSHAGDDFMSTASLVETVLTLQEQRDDRQSAIHTSVLPMYTSVIAGRSDDETGAIDIQALSVSRPDSDQRIDDASTAAAAATDLNGQFN